MAETSNKDTQFRFLLAAILSMVVLFGWGYLFPPPQPDPNTANSNSAVNSNSAANTAPETAQQTNQQQNTAPATDAPDANPNKTITIKTPLYQVKLDSKGAVATSWILLKNVSPKEPEGKPLFADGSTAENQKPLELVSP